MWSAALVLGILGTMLAGSGWALWSRGEWKRRAGEAEAEAANTLERFRALVRGYQDEEPLVLDMDLLDGMVECPGCGRLLRPDPYPATEGPPGEGFGPMDVGPNGRGVSPATLPGEEDGDPHTDPDGS